MSDDELVLWRERIAEIDRELVAVLSDRLAAARHVARVKLERGLPAFDPEREALNVERAEAALRSSVRTPDDVDDRAAALDAYRAVIVVTRGRIARLIARHPHLAP